MARGVRFSSITLGAWVFGVRAAAGATPVVFVFGGDPVEAKLVASLAQPGGNLTGITLLSFELVGKRSGLLKEALPGARRVAILANVAHPGEQAEIRTTQEGARRLGLRVLIMSRAREIADFAARRRIPAMSGRTEFAAAGSFMTYGPTLKVGHEVASQVDRILRGTKAADLPGEQPTGFELTINVVSARALGLTIPPSLRIRADRLIE
jgi:putative ABC transport system substrate-binding protein